MVSNRPFTHWGCEKLRFLLPNATVIQICRRFPSCEPVSNVKRTFYPIPFIRLGTLLYLSKNICCKCTKTITFFIYNCFDYGTLNNMIHMLKLILVSVSIVDLSLLLITGQDNSNLIISTILISAIRFFKVNSLES